MKSTIVRTKAARTPVQLHALRAGFRAAGVVAPASAAAVAEHLFRTPPRHTHPQRERAFLATGVRFDVALGRSRLAAWRWGSGPLVLLVHGWGGRAGQFGSFVPPLVRAGYSAVTFDAPGHGHSSGRRSSLPEFAAAVDVVAQASGDCYAMVGHSMGAAAVTLALRDGAETSRALFLAPSADPAGYVAQFARHLAIAPATLAAMRERICRRFHVTWDSFDVLSASRTMRIPLLVFHDWADAEVPEADGRAVANAWPDSVFVSTAGLNHRKILHHPEVVERSVRWLSG
jgi:pimeloyl-ACP methyl ester carboxylesterase